jgi:hypothetical protein
VALMADAMHFPMTKCILPGLRTFKNVVTVSSEKLASAPIGGLVTYKPGSRMVKLQTMNAVYHIEKNGLLALGFVSKYRRLPCMVRIGRRKLMI